MINFYNYYNVTALRHAWQQPLVERLRRRQYSKDLIEIEHIIKRCPVQMYMYARIAIQGRWIEVEPLIIKNSPSVAYIYARDVIHGRWPEAEGAIMTDPRIIYSYAKNILQRRWLEAEDTIKEDKSWWKYYKMEFNL